MNSSDWKIWKIEYEKWLIDCLREYNMKFRESRKYYTTPETDGYDAADLVEFSEDGAAYPHGCGGTGYVKNAVTSWENSAHYQE